MIEKGWRALRSEGRAMTDMVFYLLIMVTTFGGCYAIYGLAVAVVRLIRPRHGCRPSSPVVHKRAARLLVIHGKATIGRRASRIGPGARYHNARYLPQSSDQVLGHSVRYLWPHASPVYCVWLTVRPIGPHASKQVGRPHRAVKPA